MFPKNSCLKKLMIALAGFLVLIGLILYFPQIVFYPMGLGLYRHDHPQPGADGVVLLMGEPSLRPTIAAKEVLAGRAPFLYFVTARSNDLEHAGLIPGEDALALKMIEKTGLERERVIVVKSSGAATSTVDEAVYLANYFDHQPSMPHRLVVVTSWPHTARAGWIFDKVFNRRNVQIDMLPIDQMLFDRSDWWHSEEGMLFVFEEYVKWSRYVGKFLGRSIGKPSA